MGTDLKSVPTGGRYGPTFTHSNIDIAALDAAADLHPQLRAADPRRCDPALASPCGGPGPPEFYGRPLLLGLRGLRDGPCRHRYRKGSVVRRPTGHARPLPDRGAGDHHLFRRPLRPDGAGGLLQGAGDRPVHIPPHAAARLHRDRQGGLAAHLHQRIHGDGAPVHPFCAGFPAGNRLLSRAIQRRVGLQQLRLLPLFGQPGGVPGGLDRQYDGDGAHRPRRDRLHRPA